MTPNITRGNDAAEPSGRAPAPANPASGSAHPNDAKDPRGSLFSQIGRFGEGATLPTLLLLLIIFFSVDGATGHAFTSHANVTNLLRSQAVTGVIALAMIVPLMGGYFDLSVATNASVANVAMAAFCGSHGWPIWLSILCAIAISACFGVITGYLVAVLKLSAFVVTLGMYTLLGGLVQWYTNGQQISSVPSSVGHWSALTWLGLPRPFWLMMVVALIVWYFATHVPSGRNLEAIGSNERAASLIGISVRRMVFLSFVASGVLAGVAGVLLTSSAGLANPTAGPAYLFPAFTAVFLGATSIRPGKFNAWGTMVGIFFVAVGINGLSLLGAEGWITPVFNGAALIGAVAASTLLGRQRASGRALGLGG